MSELRLDMHSVASQLACALHGHELEVRVLQLQMPSRTVAFHVGGAVGAVAGIDGGVVSVAASLGAAMQFATAHEASVTLDLIERGATDVRMPDGRVHAWVNVAGTMRVLEACSLDGTIVSVTRVS